MFIIVFQSRPIFNSHRIKTNSLVDSQQKWFKFCLISSPCSHWRWFSVRAMETLWPTKVIINPLFSVLQDELNYYFNGLKCLLGVTIDVCGELIHVDGAVVIDGPFHENCMMQFETQADRILAFSVVNGNIIETRELFTVRELILRNELWVFKFKYLNFLRRFTMEFPQSLRFSSQEIKRSSNIQEKICQRLSTQRNRQLLCGL